MPSRRVFVTGAGGFVGRRLVPRLEAEGWQVAARDLDLDVTRPDALRNALAEAGADAVVHLAAQSSVARSFADPALCFRANYLGSLNVLRAVEAVAPQARVLLIGSADQYGGRAPGSPALGEDTPLAPQSPYARSKAAAEGAGRAAAARGCNVVRVRAFNHTGPGQADHFVAPSFARQAAEIASGLRPPRLEVGNLDSVRDFLHVDDVVDAYVRLLDPAVDADVYNVASGCGRRVRDLLEGLLERAGVAPQVHVDPERVRPTDQLVGDATRLRTRTGWVPRRDFDAILDALHDDWRARLAADARTDAPTPAQRTTS